MGASLVLRPEAGLSVPMAAMSAKVTAVAGKGDEDAPTRTATSRETHPNGMEFACYCQACAMVQYLWYPLLVFRPRIAET